MNITLYFDGLCEPKNPGGIATYGIVIYHDGNKMMEDCGLACEPWSQEASNNVAEYMGLIAGLKWLVSKGFTRGIEVRGDSQLVIRQMKGEYKVRDKRIKPLHSQAKELALRFKGLRFVWISREMNKEADSHSRRAYHEHLTSEKATSH